MCRLISVRTRHSACACLHTSSIRMLPTWQGNASEQDEEEDEEATKDTDGEKGGKQAQVSTQTIRVIPAAHDGNPVKSQRNGSSHVTHSQRPSLQGGSAPVQRPSLIAHAGSFRASLTNGPPEPFQGPFQASLQANSVVQHRGSLQGAHLNSSLQPYQAHPFTGPAAIPLNGQPASFQIGLLNGSAPPFQTLPLNGHPAPFQGPPLNGNLAYLQNYTQLGGYGFGY